MANEAGGTTESNRIHDLIFEALQENADPESEIQMTMKLLANLNEDFFRIAKKLEERQFDVSQASHQLHGLEYREKYCLIHNAEKLASLKRDLDKLTFANNAYKKKAIKTEENIINFQSLMRVLKFDQNLYFLMHHGTKNMAMEKKLLKEVNASQKKLPDHSDSDVSLVEKIDARIWHLRHSIYMNRFIKEPAIKVDEKQVLKEISQLEWAKEKAFVNASVNGKIWNSLPSKNVIKQQIKLMKKAPLTMKSDEDRKEKLEQKARIGFVKKEINIAKKDIDSLKKRLSDIRRRKRKAYKAILKLINIQDDVL